MTSLKIKYCFVVCLWLRIGQIRALFPTMTTCDGQILGKVEQTYFGETYYAYRGIPFAKPPVGPLRFRSPVPNAPWNGVLDGTAYGPKCSQPSLTDGYGGSEDCLHLNVFTKTAPNDQCSSLRPVMVWIHGGGFIIGSASEYGPGFLMDEDIILVTTQYRLGCLGFLSMPDRRVGVPGNAGLRDQVLALRWVQKHIAAFGGDPNCVTIFGASAGAASVDLLCISPMARGLFHRAIAESGVGRDPWVFNPEQSEELALGLGCYYTDQREIYKCLQQQSPSELFRIQSMLQPPLQTGQVTQFCAVVESPSNEPAFLDESVVTMIANGNFSQVPKIYGWNSDEGYIAFDAAVPPLSSLDLQAILPFGTRAKRNSTKSITLATLLFTYYFLVSAPMQDNQNFINYITDLYFLDRCYDTILKLIRKSIAKIFCYQFDYRTRMNFHYGERTPIPVTHGDEINYLFVTTNTPPNLEKNSTEYVAIRQMVKMWTTFAKTGRPIPTDTTPVLANVTWNPVVPGMFNYLVINPSMTSKVNPEPARMQLWQQFHNLEDTLID